MMQDHSLAPGMEQVHQLVTQGRISLANEAQINRLNALRPALKSLKASKSVFTIF